MTDGSAIAAPRSARFERRRREILDVASNQINRVGARGMTLTAVARELDLDTSSVTYYFRRKDVLAAACLERTLEWLADQARQAAGQPTAESRVRALIRATLALHEHQRPAGVSRLAVLSDMGSLEDDVRAPLDALYAVIFRTVRGYFDAHERAASLVAAFALLAIIHWMPAWIGSYLTSDFTRVEDRLVGFCQHGLGLPVASPSSDLGALEAEDAQTRFLHAATNLINLHGYHGASVDRIAAELGVSVGSFYHHLENKDDLVIACFERTFRLLARAHAAGEAGGGSHGDRLARVVHLLFRLQLAGASPLLRTGAYQALPPILRETMLAEAERIVRQIAGSIADGVGDGSVRPVDPLIAAQCLLAVVSSASILRSRIDRIGLDRVVSLCCQMIGGGVLAAGQRSDVD